MSHPLVTRRTVLQGLCAAMACVATARAAVPVASATADAIASALAELERNAGGRLGVCMLDTGSDRSVVWRGDERFALCSTFKLPLAAAVLREADGGRIALDQRLRYDQSDMVAHAPVTQQHLAEGGMTVAALAEAAQTTSDNVAANLLLRELGGPSALTEFFRTLGDSVTRLDRIEPDLNRVAPGEQRDTTSPRAMAATMARIMTGDVLKPSSRELLRGWMIATTTGQRRIRAGLPAGWIAGDKTGTAVVAGMANKHNDVAVIWPPRRAAMVVAAYFEADAHYDSMRAEDDAVLAQVGALAARWIGAAG